MLVAAAYLWLAAAVMADALPVLSALGLLPAVLSFQACRRLFHEAHHPARLAPAIKATIAAANLHGLLISMALMLGTRP